MNRSEVIRRLEHLHAMLEHVAPESAATVQEAIAHILQSPKVEDTTGPVPQNVPRSAAPVLAVARCGVECPGGQELSH
jgi:hypothetical protein